MLHFIDELQKLGYVLHVKNGNIMYQCNGNGKPNMEKVKCILQKIKSNKQAAIDCINGKNPQYWREILGNADDRAEKEWQALLKDARRAASQESAETQNKVYFIRAVLNYLNKKEEDKPLYKHIWKNMPISN